MTRSLQKLKKYLDHAEKIVIDLAFKFEYRKPRQLELIFEDLDKTFTLIIRNDFFKVFLSPLNQMESLVFSGGFADVHATLDIGEKARLVSRGVGKYILECKRDIAFITDQLYPLIKQSIARYIKSVESGEVLVQEGNVIPQEVIQNPILTGDLPEIMPEEDTRNKIDETGDSVC